MAILIISILLLIGIVAATLIGGRVPNQPK